MSVFLIPLAPSGFPQNPMSMTISSTDIAVMWDPVPLSQRNGDITHYEVEVNQTTLSELLDSELRQTSNGSQLMLFLTDLQEFVEYTMRVRAYTSVGPGPFSPSFSSRTFTDSEWVQRGLITCHKNCVHWTLFQAQQHLLRV